MRIKEELFDSVFGLGCGLGLTAITASSCSMSSLLCGLAAWCSRLWSIGSLLRLAPAFCLLPSMTAMSY